MGTAFEDIYSGEYYPGVGLFKNAHVKFNFGPKFKFKPEGVSVGYKPIAERTKELEVEQVVADMKFFTEQDGKLRIDNYFMSN